MRATSMSISIPAVGECNKKCPYCISNMTNGCKVNNNLWVMNLQKARKIAELSGANSIIITGKSEPLLEMANVMYVSNIFQDFPLELQTNGLLLDEKLLEELSTYINTLAISIDSKGQLDKLKDVIKYASFEIGFNVRLTINLTNMIANMLKSGNDRYEAIFNHFHNVAKEIGVSQISYRDVTIPKRMSRTDELALKTKEWIEKNVDRKFNEGFLDYAKYIRLYSGDKVCSLPFGATIYMYDGISYTSFDYCIQDENNNDDIRSLVYFDDGHLSRSWNGSNYGRIF